MRKGYVWFDAGGVEHRREEPAKKGSQCPRPAAETHTVIGNLNEEKDDVGQPSGEKTLRENAEISRGLQRVRRRTTRKKN